MKQLNRYLLLGIYVLAILGFWAVDNVLNHRSFPKPASGAVYASDSAPQQKGITIPAYSGKPWIEINKNQPFFTQKEITSRSYEHYSPLDKLGRCQKAYACLGRDLMPTKPREDISMIKPTGWRTSRYDFIDQESLYNRCHLIAFCLAGENANPKNLITGTRYMNTEGMLPFENLVCDYIKRTSNHVMYRVTPMFAG
ncbi:MAG: DNA/RNA non-specific endonuclease, partial [Abditibacteriota bacterium]|nr:DNA/RNA non-specific endonuclease [Abditibacteriota bacterium]